MIRRKLLGAASCAALLSLVACTTATTSNTAEGSTAMKRQHLNAAVDNALSQLYAQVAAAKSLVEQAKGVLVFPSISSAGFVAGGSYGRGELRERDAAGVSYFFCKSRTMCTRQLKKLRTGGATSAFYSTATASAGLLAGADSKALFVLFLTQDAVDGFKADSSWTAGADGANISLVHTGANDRIDTHTMHQAVVGFVLTDGGLLADLSLEGTRFTRLNP